MVLAHKLSFFIMNGIFCSLKREISVVSEESMCFSFTFSFWGHTYLTLGGGPYPSSLSITLNFTWLSYFVKVNIWPLWCICFGCSSQFLNESNNITLYSAIDACNSNRWRLVVSIKCHVQWNILAQQSKSKKLLSLISYTQLWTMIKSHHWWVTYFYDRDESNELHSIK